MLTIKPLICFAIGLVVATMTGCCVSDNNACQLSESTGLRFAALPLSTIASTKTKPATIKTMVPRQVPGSPSADFSKPIDQSAGFGDFAQPVQDSNLLNPIAVEQPASVQTPMSQSPPVQSALPQTSEQQFATASAASSGPVTYGSPVVSGYEEQVQFQTRQRLVTEQVPLTTRVPVMTRSVTRYQTQSEQVPVTVT